MTGLGVIGPARHPAHVPRGAGQLIAADMIESRRALARTHGATHVVDPSAEGVAEAVRDLTDGRGADVVIEVSGAARALNEAVRVVGYNGLVVAMSWYGGTFESLDLSGRVPPQPAQDRLVPGGRG